MLHDIETLFARHFLGKRDQMYLVKTGQPLK